MDGNQKKNLIGDRRQMWKIKFVIADKVFEYGEYLTREIAKDVFLMIQSKYKNIHLRLVEEV